jgi:type VI secretion system protein ImpF
MQSTRLTHFGFAPTLFEKLFDDRPRYVSEINPLRRWNIEELKGSVARDLEALLNTRRSFSKALDAYPLVRRSVLNFGILDFVGLSTANPEHCDRICKEIEQTITIQGCHKSMSKWKWIVTMSAHYSLRFVRC